MEDELDLINNVLKDPNKSSDLELVNSLLKSGNGMTYNNMFEAYSVDRVKNNAASNDYLSVWDNPEDGDEIYEKQANRQSWLSKASSGVARAGTKALSEVLKIPGIGAGIIEGISGQIADGISGQDNTDFMTVAFDNAWVRSLNDANEWINDEVLPVYVKKAVSEGNLWDNITSIDFWATDGADGLGYIAAMLAPGAILNRLKLGKALVGTAGELSGVSKGLSFSDDALTGMQKMAKLGLPTNAKNIDLYAQTIANTTLEAGIEAQQAGKEYEDENLHRTELDPSDPNYLSEEDFRNNKANIMGNIFKGNAVILIGPNAIMSKMLWGGARNSTRGLRNYKFEDGAIKQIEKKGALKTINEIGQEFGKAFVREGFWEEGMQSATSDYFSANPEAGFLSSIGEIPQSYADMISTTEGLKAIFLGGAFGGGMQNITNFKQSKKERENTNKLISYTNNKFDNYWKKFEGDIYKKDENGKTIKDENGKPELDEKVAIERLQRLNQLEQLSDVYDQALTDGNVELASQLRNEADISFIAEFLNDSGLGIEVLNQYLQTAPGVEIIAQNEGVSKESIISDIMDKAKALELANQTFDNFSDSILDVKNDKATKKDTQTFFQGLRDKYFAIKARRHFVNKQLESLDNQLNNLIKEKGRTREQYDNNGKLAIELNNTDARFESVNDKIKNYKKAQKELDNIENDFWNKKAVQKDFDAKIEQANKLAKEKAEKEEEVTNTLNQVENAKNDEELDNISKTNTSADQVINDAIIEKRKQLKEEEEARKQAKADEQQKQSEANKETNNKKQEEKEDLGAKIDGYNTGEEFSLTKGELLPYIDNLDQNEYTGIIESDENNTEDSVTIRIQETGEEITIPKKVNKPQPTNLHQEFNTEGSVNHDDLTPKVNENTQDDSRIDSDSGTPLLSKDRTKGREITYEKNGKKFKTFLGEAFEYVKRNFLDYEKKPENKKGTKITFSVKFKDGTEKKWDNRWSEATVIYNKVINKQPITEDERQKLVDYLPINGHINGSDVFAPINTKYQILKNGKWVDSKRYEKSGQKLRNNIVNALEAGAKIEDISTTVEGQYGGVLIVDSLDENNKVRENNILELFHFNGMSDKAKIEYVRENIGMINQQGDFIHLDGSMYPFNKPNGKGELYLLIPKANGEMFPLKLNIRRLNNDYKEGVVNDILAGLYKTLLSEQETKGSTLFNNIKDESLKQLIKDNLDEEKKLIGKPWGDITVSDFIEFLVFDRAKSLKSRIGFVNPQDPNQFVYGDPNKDGKTINSVEEFDEAHFKEWLSNNKRQNIRIVPYQNDTSKANMRESDAYIEYLLNNGILNTNAVVGNDTPTFQGTTNIYLDSNNVRVNGKPQQANVSTQSTQLGEIKDSEYNNFVNNGEVSEKRLINIANKVKNQEELSERENAIFIDKTAEINNLIASNEQQPIPNQKADIERRRQEDLNIGIPLNNYLSPFRSPKESLVKFREYLTDVLGWERMPIGYTKPNLTLTYKSLGIELEIPALIIQLGGNVSNINLQQQGGGSLNLLEIDIKDVINAKYDAEIARELYKEMKVGKQITEFTAEEQSILNNPNIFTQKLRDSVDAELAALESSTTTTKDTYKDAINSIKQDKNGNWVGEYENSDGIFQSIKGEDEADVLRQINKLRDNKSSEPTGVASTVPASAFGIQPQKVDNLSEAIPDGAEANEATNNYLNNMFSSSKGENTDNNNRNSQKSFVSSHEVPNSKENTKVKEVREASKVKDKIQATKEDINKARKEIIDAGLFKIGSKFADDFFKLETNQEKYDYLNDELIKHGKRKNSIEKDCNGV